MKQLRFGVHPITYPQKILKSGKASTVIPANLGEVAIWNEYGTKTIPPRPAFRMGLEAALKTRKKNIQSFLKRTAVKIIQTGRDKEMQEDLRKLLIGIGQSAKKETQDIIKAGSTTPNAPSTVARKGFNHPLKETGLLLDNIAYEVTD